MESRFHRTVRGAYARYIYNLDYRRWVVWRYLCSVFLRQRIHTSNFSLFTEACQQIQWLHHRMPVCIWDMKLALHWMDNPSAKILQALDQAARLKNEEFDWHMVTTAMSSLKFRDKAAIQAIKVQTKSVTAYFQKSPVTKQSRDPKKAIPSTAEKSQEKEAAKQAMKRVTSSPSKSPSPKKQKSNTATPKPKKGLITGFFQKKG